MRKPIFFIKVLCFMVVILLYPNANAVMIAMSIERITQKAELVIVGEVENVEMSRTKDKSFINSIATVRVEEVLKGETSSQSVLVEYPGGIVDGIGMAASDVIWLYKGDRVLLFLKSFKSEVLDGDTFSRVGAWQGTFKIDEKGRTKGEGFTIVDGKEMNFLNPPVSELKEMIRRVK